MGVGSVKRSTNGGYSFENAVIVRGGTYGNDKPFFTIDKNPNSPFFNRIYVAYINFCETYKAKIEFTYSTNIDPGVESLNFSTPIALTDCEDFVSDKLLNGAFPLVNPNNQVYVFWLRSTSDDKIQYFFNRSQDGGRINVYKIQAGDFVSSKKMMVIK